MMTSQQTTAMRHPSDGNRRYSSTKTSGSETEDVHFGLSFDRQYKILMLGDSGVGKSSIILRFTNDRYTPNFLPTIGIDFKTKMMTVPPSSTSGAQRSVKLVLWDSAGQERFRTITKSYLRGSHAVAIVYDCTDRQSFENVDMWLAQLEEMCISAAVALVANKSDSAVKAVSEEEGRELARERGMPFFTTSAKMNTGVDQVFMYLAMELLRREKLRSDSSMRSTSTGYSATGANNNGSIKITMSKLDAADGRVTGANTCCGGVSTSN
jgi:small GTP-binding protein